MTHMTILSYSSLNAPLNKTESKATLNPLHTRAQVESSNLHFWEFNKLSTKAQTIQSLTDLKSANSLCKCKVAMLKVRYYCGNDIKERNSMTCSGMRETPLAWDPQNKSSMSLRVDRELVFIIPHEIHGSGI